MSDLKRVVLSSVDAGKSSAKADQKTYRFELTLTESNESTCPIFDYSRLLAKREREEAANDFKPELDYHDNDADVQRIAQMFEKKYGNATDASGKKKKKREADEYYDIGLGYDENDSFIDNTEAYDEVVPDDLEPVHGGYYVNSGNLEYDAVPNNQNESLDSDEFTPKAAINCKKSKVLDDSTDSEMDFETTLTAEKVEQQKGQFGQVVVERKKEQHASEKPLNVLLPKKKNLCNGRQKHVKTSVEKRKHANGHKRKEDNNRAKQESTDDPTTSNQDDDSDSSSTTKSSQSLSSSSSDSSDASDSETTKPRDNGVNIDKPTINGVSERLSSKLPSNLPEKSVQTFELLVAEANSYLAQNTKETSIEVFNEPIKKYLISLEKSLHNVSKSQTDCVYSHLAIAFHLKTESFLKRLNKLLLNEEDIRLDNYKKRLKSCIDKSMPTLMQNFEKKREDIRMFNEISTAKKSWPKRRFQWDDEARALVEKIIHTKRRTFKLEKITSTKFQVYLEEYYKEHLVPLWPKSWINLHQLMKVSLCHLNPDELTFLPSGSGAEKVATKPTRNHKVANVVHTLGDVVDSKSAFEHLEKLSKNNVEMTLVNSHVDKSLAAKIAEGSVPSMIGNVTIQPILTNERACTSEISSKLDSTSKRANGTNTNDKQKKLATASTSQIPSNLPTSIPVVSSSTSTSSKSSALKHVRHETESDQLQTNQCKRLKTSDSQSSADDFISPLPATRDTRKPETSPTESVLGKTFEIFADKLLDKYVNSDSPALDKSKLNCDATTSEFSRQNAHESVAEKPEVKSNKGDAIAVPKAECFSPKKKFKEAYENSQQQQQDNRVLDASKSTELSRDITGSSATSVKTIMQTRKDLEVIELDDTDDSIKEEIFSSPLEANTEKHKLKLDGGNLTSLSQEYFQPCSSKDDTIFVDAANSSTNSPPMTHDELGHEEMMNTMNSLKELQRINEIQQSAKSASGSAFISKYSPIKSRPTPMDMGDNYSAFQDVFHRHVNDSSKDNLINKFKMSNR